MSTHQTVAHAPDIQAGRLDPAQYTTRFQEAVGPLTPGQAVLEAERCLYCYDAPCATACPTSIDVPSFIHRIADGNLRGAAHAILEPNPLGGMCARVCPTENLCEAVCVRNTQEARPVAIGRLQRFAVDALLASPQPQLFTRAAATGKTVAVVGAGPAGLSCAHRLARLGHQVVVLDAHPQPGGLNEYGLASYKMADSFAQQEIAWLLEIGGIAIRQDWRLQTVDQLNTLRQDFDAVFLALGLAGTKSLDIPGEDLQGVQNAVDFIATLRQTKNKAHLPIGRRVIVIGGGMTAVDAAVQSKLLGASVVHMVYRRGPEHMSASRAEQEWAQTNGVVLHHGLAPQEILGANGHVQAVRFVHTSTGRAITWEADMVFKAIGQTLGNPVLSEAGLALPGERIATDSNGQTPLAGVWAGGDCRAAGLDLTVQAVAHGQQSAHAIHAYLAPSH